MMPLKNVPALVVILTMVASVIITNVDGALTSGLLKNLSVVNRRDYFLGVVMPNAFEMNPIFESHSFVPSKDFPYLWSCA